MWNFVDHVSFLLWYEKFIKITGIMLSAQFMRFLYNEFDFMHSNIQIFWSSPVI